MTPEPENPPIAKGLGLGGDPCICGARPHHSECYQDYKRWWMEQKGSCPPAVAENIKIYNERLKPLP